eukprot:3047632-Rhodomonas_salina.3
MLNIAPVRGSSPVAPPTPRPSWRRLKPARRSSPFAREQLRVPPLVHRRHILPHTLFAHQPLPDQPCEVELDTCVGSRRLRQELPHKPQNAHQGHTMHARVGQPLVLAGPDSHALVGTGQQQLQGAFAALKLAAYLAERLAEQPPPVLPAFPVEDDSPRHAIGFGGQRLPAPTRLPVRPQLHQQRPVPLAPLRRRRAAVQLRYLQVSRLSREP